MIHYATNDDHQPVDDTSWQLVKIGTQAYANEVIADWPGHEGIKSILTQYR